ncbi:uracil-DNA glycosylase family protein [Leptolyngbya sp. 7M]|uniref:uracil-DNA glycosylase n=1 Tax=Leptolyngbya sp. 7M TaxID=2812896 RepID=UPI001B8BADCC|nr:uracil-DNA glycosylase [Leptolyngbya sp. 7M]QYO66657.1 uracil-DNA glycosylase [Leptolyngbya sp. 7M]
MREAEFSELVKDIREQVRYLKELGVDAISVDLPEEVFSVKTPRPSDRDLDQIVKAPNYSGSTEPERTIAFPKLIRSDSAPKRPGSRLSALPSLKRRNVANPEVTLHRLESVGSARDVEMKTTSATIETSSRALPIMDETTDTITSIREEIGECKRCPLHALGRKQIVHTTGNFNADLMFIGEAPGADEDEQGFPFVGRAGQLLTKIIESIGLKREEVCIGNINRCRPPGNRKPEPVETAACRPFILREIAVVKPRVVVVLGATAAHNLLQVKTPITKLRGEFHDYFGVKVMPTFHPAYLLRDPHKKREVWEDMKKVRELLNS